MDTFLLIIGFFLGLIILFIVGEFIGHLLKLDEYLKYDHDVSDSKSSVSTSQGGNTQLNPDAQHRK